MAVSVATLWRSPTSARVVDRPALANPAGIRPWLSRMTLADRRGLNGRADTQALMGDRVIVIARSRSWVKVVVPDQPTPLDRRGYPGWVPTAQLTAVRPLASGLVATVVARTSYLRTDNASATPVTEISFGTRLPRVGVTGAWVRVATPTGVVRRIYASTVVVRAPGAAALPATGAGVVRTAQLFAGLPYLWAGRSGFGFDCSGLTSLDFRAHGRVIPRDADAQAVGGKVVSSSALRPGDLLFYATRGLRAPRVDLRRQRPDGAVTQNRQHGPDDRGVHPLIRARVRRRLACHRMTSRRTIPWGVFQVGSVGQGPAPAAAAGAITGR